MVTKVKREKWIDAVKGIGILLMIAGHTGLSYKGVSYRWIIYGFHMPLFFIIAGYLHNEEKWNSKGMKNYISCRFRAYVIPYFILSGINLLICLAEYVIKCGFNGLADQFIRWCFGIVWSYADAQHTPNCTPLWFLIGLFIAEILFTLLLKLKKKWMRVFACMVFLIGAMVLAGYPDFQPPWNTDAALLGCVFIYIGYLVKKYELLQRGSSVIIISGITGIV